MIEQLKCFTAYDVRGRVPADFNPEIARRIALAFADQFALKKIVVGRDMRLSSPEIAAGVSEILLNRGVDVVDVGLSGSEEMYYAVYSGGDQGIDGGIMITASHNPADYNGMKLVQRGARPVSRNSGLPDIAKKAGSESWYVDARKRQGLPGTFVHNSDKGNYIKHLLGYVDSLQLTPLKLVVNAGNGCAGPVIDELEQHLPFSFVKMNHVPDGTFPNGVPNPLLPEKREATAQAVLDHGADMGIAWDGDFDRCFFYDETGRFIEGYYIVGLLALAMLQRFPGASILHDPRLVWNTREIVHNAGGKAIMTPTGHAFIKEKMREVDAVYGGEMSAHHYFREFGYCDSGMIPWLLICQLLSTSGKKFSSMVDEGVAAYPVSGEINLTVADPSTVIEEIQKKYAEGDMDFTDGLSVEFPGYRFNVRMSNTEPVLRLNVETRGDELLLKQKTEELVSLIRLNG